MSAVERLKGTNMLSMPNPIERTVSSNQTAPRNDVWQKKAGGIIERAVRLLATPEGQPGRDYLIGRGFELATCQKWRLGFRLEVQRWEKQDGEWVVVEQMGSAITIPWMDEDGPLALQQRLIGHERFRYWQQTGGERTVFGLDHLTGKSTLVIVEGEFNCVSISQAAGDLLDVVSYGSESISDRTIPHLQTLATRYQHVIFWADKEERALEAVQIGKGLVLVKSPLGLDANDLLRAGRLRRHLENLLRRIGAPVPTVIPPQGGQNESAELMSAPVQEAISGDIRDEVQASRSSADELEAQLEQLLEELGRARGIGMEFVRPRHPAHETYLRFCELERQWMISVGH